MPAAAISVRLPDESRKLSYLALIQHAASSWIEDNCPRLAAALSFYTFLSIAPLLIITAKIAFLFFDPYTATSGLNQQVTGLVGAAGAKAINEMIQNAGKPGAGNVATIISFFVLLFSATGVFIELQDSMDIIWEVRPRPHQGMRGFIRNRLMSIAMVMGIAFILLVSLFVSATLSAVTRKIGGGPTVVSFSVDLAISTVVITVLFALIFKYLPDAKIEWRNVWIGALTTAILFELGKYGLTLYFKFASASSTYGAFGSLAALLIWVYYSAQLVFFGAEFTQVFAAATGHRILPDSNAVARSEQDRIAAGIPHDAVLEAAAAGPRGPLAIQPPRTSAVNKVESPNALRVGAIAGCVGLAAGATLAYLGREGLSSGVLRVYRRKAEQAAAHNLRDRIDQLKDLPRRDRSVRLEDLDRRIDALGRRIALTARRTVPPASNKM